MQYKKTSFGFIVALEPGDELIASLIELARHEDVDGAALYGLGAVDHVELAHYDPVAQEYGRGELDEPLEACTLVGNLALLDGEPMAHVHGVFGRPDFTTVGGHVFAAVCSATLEIAVHTAAEPIVRGASAFRNLQLMNLEETR